MNFFDKEKETGTSLPLKKDISKRMFTLSF
jgi:hypothetical protein